MQQPSRRAVLRAAVVVTASAAIPAALAAPAGAAAPRRVQATRLRRRVFRPHVRTSFHLTGGGRTYRAVLEQVADDPVRPGETRFSLVFRMAGGVRPAAGVYTVTHPRLRAFGLYVGAVGDPAAGRYEAVVNS